MGRIQITVFGGEIPKMGEGLLPAEAATVATNARLGSGELTPWEKMSSVKIAQGVDQAVSFYPVGDKVLTWAEDTDIEAGPIPNDIHKRVYYTNASEGPRVFSEDSVTEDEFGRATMTSYKLGVPAPVNAPVPSVLTNGSSTTIEDTTYAYSFVSEWGEEGPLSPPSVVFEKKVDDLITLVDTDTTVPDGYNIKIKRMYRSIVASDGSAIFVFIKDRPLTQATVNDSPDGGSFGEECPSVDWDAPVDTLRGLTAMPGNFFAAFSGNEIFFSSPSYPHAWPNKYALNTPHNIVGLGVVGTVLVVLTEAYVHFVNVPDPELATMTYYKDEIPCLAKRGIISTRQGVFFPSSDGLYMTTQVGVENATVDLFTRRDWRGLDPDTIHSIAQNDILFLFNNNTNAKLIDLREAQARVTGLNWYVTGAYLQPEDNKLMFIMPEEGNQIVMEWQGDSENSFQYEWVSKEFLLPEDTNFSCAKVVAHFPNTLTQSQWDEIMRQLREEAEYEAEYQGKDGSLGGCLLNDFALNGDALDAFNAEYTLEYTLTMELIADGKVVHSQNIESDQPFLLPAGFTSNKYKVRLQGDIVVQAVSIATSMPELAVM